MPSRGQDKAASPTFHGVNLAGWLVLESWATPELFTGTGALDEAGLVRALGPKRYAEHLRQHRETFVTERDFARIATRGFDCVRLPVPWYVFGKRGPLPGGFQGCVTQVDHAFDWAESHGLGILLDLAEVPVVDDGFGAASMVSHPMSRNAAIAVLCALAKRYASRPALMGIEVLDEPVPQVRHGFSISEGIPLHALRNFYRDAYDAIRRVAPESCAVVISDAGLPGSWKGFMAQRRYTNVWLDCHLYHFAADINASGPTGARILVERSRKALSAARSSGLPVIVGEWSSALPVGDAQITPEGRLALERVYTSAQISAFASSRGWFFQTWKTSGLVSGWDARVALSSFELGMFE